MASTLATSSFVNFHPPAATLADTWSIFRAPAMTVLSHGLATTPMLLLKPRYIQIWD